MPTKPPLPLQSLTGIRGVAAIWIILYHLMQASHFNIPFARQGFRAVDLFFLLSGFILMHVHASDFLVLRLRETYRFFALRVVRVYPLSTVVLLLVLIAVLAEPQFVTWYRHLETYYADAFSLKGFGQTFFLANRWVMRDLGEWNGPTWSLSVEFLAYGIFPMAAFFMGKEKSRRRCLAYVVIALGVLVAFQLAMGHAERNEISRISILRVMCCFIAGMAVCQFCKIDSAQPDQWPLQVGERRWPARLAAGSCLVLLILTLIPRASVLAPFCFAGLILGLFYQEGKINSFLSRRPIVFLGEISFPLYLIHFVPLQMFRWLIETHQLPATRAVMIGGGILLLEACFVAAFLLHRFLEKPAQRKGKALVQRTLVYFQEPQEITEVPAAPAQRSNRSDRPRTVLVRR